MDKIPAHVQPRLKSWSDWRLENRRGAGPLCIIVIVTAVLAWHTMMLPERSPLLVVLVAVQIALFGLSYWIQPSWIPLALILALSMMGDCVFPQYSDYVMNAQLAALGLLAYWTNDIWAGLTLVVLSAYQWIWLIFSPYAQSDTFTVVLFIALFAVAALIGSIARHLAERAYRQQQMMQAMRSGIRAMAMDLHDAVSGSLTTAELLLQQCEVEADITSAIADPMWKECNRCIHAEIHNAEDNVKGIVDLLLAEYGESDEEKAQHQSIRTMLDAHDEQMSEQGINGRSALVTGGEGAGVLREHDMRMLCWLIDAIYECIRQSHPDFYELSVTIDNAHASVMLMHTGNTAALALPHIPWNKRLRVHVEAEKRKESAMVCITVRLHRLRQQTQQEATAHLLAKIQCAQKDIVQEKKPSCPT
ncbi:hypothetical protein ACLUVW_03160 [Bifidobacterium pseudolongum subsp. globosum]|uniref:hypothetical protein n=1 Tax=Bifidobacterium pseudolongum TaxID=1694 RepID=UPI003990F29F